MTLESGTSAAAVSTKLKLILHTQDGSIPYLSPHLLQSYFSPETNLLVQNHLILGVAVKDTSIVPTFAGKTGRAEKTTGPCKPTGFTFQPISLHSRLRLSPGYSTLLLPTFDLMDDFEFYYNSTIMESSRKRKHNKEDDVSTTTPSTTTLIKHSNTFCTNKHVSLVTPHGIHAITPQQYVNIVKESSSTTTDQPTATAHHYILGLFDQLEGSEGDKRRNTWMQRMIHWTPMIAANMCAALKNGSTKTVTEMEPNQLWIPMDIHLNTSELEKYLHHVQHLHPHQFAIVGWHRMNGSRIQRREILHDMIGNLNNSLQGTLSLSLAVLCTMDLFQFLDAIQCGVTCVGSDLPQRWAQEGKALCLFENSLKPVVMIAVEQQEDEKNPVGWIHVRDDRFMRDRDPLIQGCQCLSCKNRIHSRAYIHHLIQANELLAQILLFGHNLHQMLLLMEYLTYMDTLGTLDEFCSRLERCMSSLCV